jgi:hypothetical protein
VWGREGRLGEGSMLQWGVKISASVWKLVILGLGPGWSLGSPLALGG